MIADSDLADLCMAIYKYPWFNGGGPTVRWDHLSEGGPVVWALKRTVEFDVIAFRGSTTICDWFTNFMALAIPIDHGPIGPVHPGFRNGCDAAWKSIKPLLKRPYVLTGHSLGGAHAAIIAGMAKLENNPPVRRVTFGEPRPGFKKLAALNATVSSTLYQNSWDVVPEIPVRFAPFENYCHSHPLKRIDIIPHGRALEFGPFAWHHMSLYAEATKGENSNGN